MSIATLPTTLGPLTGTQRASIMAHARYMSHENRRVFRRLLVLSQEHGLSQEVIARLAVDAAGHVVPGR